MQASSMMTQKKGLSP